MNASDGEAWTVRPTPALAQANKIRDGAMGNDCGLGVIYGLMYYIQHGQLSSQKSCRRSKCLFHTLKSWLLGVVLSGSLHLPTNGLYLRNALTELGSSTQNVGPVQLVMPIDRQPDPSAHSSRWESSRVPVAVIEHNDCKPRRRGD